MEFVQNLLTAASQIIALAGFGGIALHAIYKQHAKIAAIYAEVPHATPYSPKPQAEVEEVVEPVTKPATELQPVIPEQLMLVIQHHEHPVTEPIAELQPVIGSVIADPWAQPITTSSRRWAQSQPTKPTLALPPAKQQTPTFEGYSPARLKKIAKSLKIKRYSVMQPQELMVAITQHPSAAKYLTA